MIMNFRPAIKTDLKTVMTWIPDAESCLIWAGPRVKFPLELEQLYQDIEFEKILTYSLYDEKELLALGQIRMFENNRGHLSRIVVNPSSRGKGIGRIFGGELINEAKKLNCRTISLNVVKDNLIAISLYKKLGFMIPSKQPDNVRENIVYMELG
jgi:ribosomal protein S18 acetylase RimI-like enzyme